MYKNSGRIPFAPCTPLLFPQAAIPRCLPVRGGFILSRLSSSAPLQERRKKDRLLLAFFWCAGLFCGMSGYLTAGMSFLPWMRGAVLGSVSIVGLLGITILPFLISALAVSFSIPWLQLLVCFCKAFLFSFVSLGVWQAFGSAGWLAWLLLMFSDCMGMPLLYGFWLRHLSGDSAVGRLETGCYLAAFVLLGSVDYRIISPFWMRF